MYLAPLNYDRFFKKVFSDLKIAKRFLEDFLDITILELEFLPDKQNITNDAQTVEFDFRCKTAEGYFIIEMQQWYKTDVIHRFYVYHALNSALQLETMPKKVIPLADGTTRSVRDYSELLPIITIIWMVHDTFNFTDDYVGYILTPEYITNFIKEAKEWKSKSSLELAKKIETMYQMVNKTEKNLDFLQKNRMIYVFQKNVVANQKYEKYFPWFALAEKTLKKVADKFAYDEYLKDEIYSEVVRKLKIALSEADSEGYIKSYEEYIDGVQRFERGIEQNAEKKFIAEIQNAKAKEEQAQREKTKALKERADAQNREEEERRQKEEAQNKLARAVKRMLSKGFTETEIAEDLEISVDEVHRLIH